MRKIPTGIETFDSVTDGGIPESSFILLHGRLGTKKSEFAHTITGNCAAIKSNPILLPERNNIYLPENIWYATFSRDKEEILSDVQHKFSDEFYGKFSENISFKSFLPTSARPTKFPDWISHLMEGESRVSEWRSGTLAQLGKFLEIETSYSLVVLYTLSDIARFFHGEREAELTSFLQSLRRMCRRWKGVIISLLSKGILPERMEEFMVSTADVVLSFELRGKGLKRRQNTVYARKYRGTSADLSEPFEINLTPNGVVLERVKSLL